MARVIVTGLAAADLERILRSLAHEAGPSVARDYRDRFKFLYARLAQFPERYQPRLELGAATKIHAATRRHLQ
jgi:plasmid stabilization system protein ParE